MPTPEGHVDITGLNKADVVVALYKGTRRHGMGLLQSELDEQQVREIATKHFARDGKNYDIDYLAGKPLKVDLAGDSFDPRLYDRDAGPGAAQRAVNKLRNRNLGIYASAHTVFSRVDFTNGRSVSMIGIAGVPTVWRESEGEIMSRYHKDKKYFQESFMDLDKALPVDVDYRAMPDWREVKHKLETAMTALQRLTGSCAVVLHEAERLHAADKNIHDGPG